MFSFKDNNAINFSSIKFKLVLITSSLLPLQPELLLLVVGRYRLERGFNLTRSISTFNHKVIIHELFCFSSLSPTFLRKCTNAK